MTAARIISLWAPVALYMGLLYALSARSTLPITPDVPDKLLHSIAYTGLGLVTLRAAHGGIRRLRPVAAVVAIALSLAYASFDEIHQAFVPGRDPSVRDAVADAIGVTVAVVVFGAVGAWLSRSPTASAGERGRRGRRPS